MPHVSPLELATYLNGTTELGDLTDEFVAQATLLLEQIAADIEVEAGVPLEAGSGTVLLAGTWSRDLVLPEGPIRSVSAVAVDGVTQAAASYWWNERTLIRRGSSPLSDDDGDEWPHTPQGAQARDGVYWSSPASTITVDYAWGFDDVPAFVRSLELRIAARTIGNAGGAIQESLAVYSVTYPKIGDQSSHLSERERRRLRQLLRVRGGTIAPVAL